jgi:hypothetical protein
LRCRRCLCARENTNEKYCGEPNYHGAESEHHNDELPQQSLRGIKGNEIRIAFSEKHYQRSDPPATG